MTQTGIPFVFMRGGTSRGPYFNRADLPEEGVPFLETIGKQRGCLGSGGHVDFDRAATLLISEYRGGRLGQLTLETPAMAEQEHVKVAEIRRLKEEEKKAKKKARKAAYKAKGSTGSN